MATVSLSDMNRALLEDLTGADVKAAAEPARDAMSATFMVEMILLMMRFVNCGDYESIQ